MPGAGFWVAMRQAMAAMISVAVVVGQTPAPTALTLPKSSYLSWGSVPPNVQAYLRATGTKLLVSGNERMTLTGTSTDGTGTGPAVLVWQLPGNVSLTRTTAPNASLVFLSGSGPSTASALAQADQDVLEDLSSGTQEAFLYSFTQKVAHRLLGTGFRTNNGTGPSYDIYEEFGPVAAANNAVRQKWFFFDASSGLLMRVRYLLNRNGSTLTVEDQFSAWGAQNGQPYPGQIVRTENGTAVFTFKTAQAAFGPALNDTVFGGH
jgi:hypothetical protein